jgi:ribose-phosphate pyrophosphokinase
MMSHYWIGLNCHWDGEKAHFKLHSDGEIVLESFVNHPFNTYIVQPINIPIHDHMMALMMMANSCDSHSQCIIPYLPFTRGNELALNTFFKMCESMNIQKIIHAVPHHSIHNKFNIDMIDISFDHFFDYSIKHNPLYFEDIDFVISPDHGGADRAHYVGNYLNKPIIIFDKTRVGNDVFVNLQNNIHDFKNKKCLMVDDMIDSGKTIIHTSNYLQNQGARAINVFAIHGVLSHSDSISNLKKSTIDHVMMFDTLTVDDQLLNSPQWTIMNAEIVFKNYLNF